MTYWLDVFTPKSGQEFNKAGATVSGFPDRRWNTVQRMRVGDILICYMKAESCWFAALEVTSKPFQDYENRIWSDDVYPCRVPVKPVVVIEPKKAIKVKEILPTLKLFAKMPGGLGWGVLLRVSPRTLPEEDGSLIMTKLNKLKTAGIEVRTGGLVRFLGNMLPMNTIPHHISTM